MALQLGRARFVRRWNRLGHVVLSANKKPPNYLGAPTTDNSSVLFVQPFFQVSRSAAEGLTHLSEWDLLVTPVPVYP